MESRTELIDSELDSKKKKRNRRKRHFANQRHLKQLWKITQHHYIHPPVLYVDFIRIEGSWHNRKVPYYRKNPPNHGGIGRRVSKKISNRRVRYYKNGISKGGNYRKIFDYQWSID